MNLLQQIDDAVFIQDDQVKTTSLKIAEIFKKRHDHVLRKIENILTMKSTALNFKVSEFTAPNFGVSEFTEFNFQLSKGLDSGWCNLPIYEMIKDDFINISSINSSNLIILMQYKNYALPHFLFEELTDPSLHKNLPSAVQALTPPLLLEHG